ncbi:unnamed protein product [Owenia fusiformis]|uniref:Uncharacterized protein n=1 Tax=Owenia fusiformis TaxID=6347 RepID=A0A8J1TMR6_OWEFU|nr:unnamed protein product [Owenia fusiformis]
MPGGKKKLYAVARGLKLGIFEEWSTVERLTKKVKDCRFKSFNGPDAFGAAIGFLKINGVTFDIKECELNKEFDPVESEHETSYKARLRGHVGENKQEDTITIEVENTEDEECIEIEVENKAKQGDDDIVNKDDEKNVTTGSKHEVNKVIERENTKEISRESPNEGENCKGNIEEQCINRMNTLEANMVVNNMETSYMKGQMNEIQKSLNEILPTLKSMTIIKKDVLENEKKNKEIETYRSKFEKLSIENETLKGKLKQKEMEYDILESTKENMEKEMDELQVQFRKKDKEVRDLQRNKDEIEDRICVRIDEIEELLQTKEKTLIEKNVIIKEKEKMIIRLEDRLENMKLEYERNGEQWKTAQTKKQTDEHMYANDTANKKEGDSREESSFIFTHDSIAKYLDIRRWAQDLRLDSHNVKQYATYTLQGTKEKLENVRTTVTTNTTIVNHTGINDIRQHGSPETAADEYIEWARNTAKDCKNLIISLPCPTEDRRLNEDIAIFKDRITQGLKNTEKVHFIMNHEFGDKDGFLNRQYKEFGKTHCHLNKYEGTYLLAGNIKYKVQYVMGIPRVKRDSAQNRRQFMDNDTKNIQPFTHRWEVDRNRGRNTNEDRRGDTINGRWPNDRENRSDKRFDRTEHVYESRDECQGQGSLDLLIEALNKVVQNRR